MNANQRWANRRTAREARHLLHGSSPRFTAIAGGGSMAVISSRDLRRGSALRPAFFCVDDLDCSAPTAVEKAPEFATALDMVWVSTSVLSPIRYIDAPARETT